MFLSIRAPSASGRPFALEEEYNRKGVYMIEDLTPLVANLGFPIVVSLYLLIRVEKKLDELTACVKEANKNIAKML